MIDEIFPLILISAVLLSSLVTGLVFGFAIVTMPGIAKLSNKNFLNAFKNIDEVIQKNQPIFMLVWIGSIMAVILTLTLGILLLSGMEKILLLSASLLYLLGVQLPTVFYNIPLNNMIQELDINLMEDSELEKSRSGFEKSWNRWNNIRTLNGIVAVFIWLVLLIRL
ncbi:MAG: anthrone oxygenase family protein [Candidatus Thalassarchaeaceae archaeon]